MATALNMDPVLELKRLVAETQRKEALQPDEAFVLWFVRTYLVSNEETSRGCLTRRGNDKGVDAIYIDHSALQVSLVQGKWRTKGIGKPEGRGEVLQLAQFGRWLTDDQPGNDGIADTADVSLRDRLKEARRFVQNKGYQVKLFFVTTGSISGRLQRDAEEIACLDGQVTFVPIHGKSIQRIIADYVFDAAPGVPTLDLDITDSRILPRHDDENKIDSYVFTMNGRDVGDLMKKAGRRLFARNIRGYLGKESEVNRSIIETLAHQPQNFWYFNNGVTVICDSAQERGTAGRKWLSVKNPQIINGQQTTYTLSEYSTRQAEVLVKVIAIPRERTEDFGRFDDLVSQIVAATNWQNKIVPSDLKANDPEQIRIERELRKRDILYIRKRVGKGVARSQAAIKPKETIKKEELAQSVGAAILDPYYVRAGKETLFEADLYSKIFSSGRDISEYLTAFYLNCVCRYEARGDYLCRYGRWLAINFLWNRLRKNLGVRSFRQKFVFAYERWSSYWRAFGPLMGATYLTYRALKKFYKRNNKTKDGQLDPSTFFKYRHRDSQFDTFFNSRANPYRSKFQRELGIFTKKIETVEM